MLAPPGGPAGSELFPPQERGHGEGTDAAGAQALGPQQGLVSYTLSPGLVPLSQKAPQQEQLWGQDLQQRPGLPWEMSNSSQVAGPGSPPP